MPAQNRFYVYNPPRTIINHVLELRMNTAKIGYIDRLPNEDRLDAFERCVLPKFDTPVKVIRHLATSTEVYLILNKEIHGKPTNFILITYIRKRLINRVKSWEIVCYFEWDSPPYYNCPEQFFELCPTTNPKSIEWRRETRLSRNRKASSLKNNLQVLKFAESFEVGDVLIHPVYGELKIEHICMKERAYWCLNHKHVGSRKYKFPLMEIEEWEKNLKKKQSNKLEINS